MGNVRVLPFGGVYLAGGLASKLAFRIPEVSFRFMQGLQRRHIIESRLFRVRFWKILACAPCWR
jgi:hypothetical protein